MSSLSDKQLLAETANNILHTIKTQNEENTSLYIDIIGKPKLIQLFQVKVKTTPTTSPPEKKLPWSKVKDKKVKEREQQDIFETTRQGLLSTALDKGFEKVALTLLECGCDPCIQGEEVRLKKIICIYAYTDHLTK